MADGGNMHVINEEKKERTRNTISRSEPLSFERLVKEEEDKYTELAAELGISTTALDNNKFRAFLTARGLAPYSYGEVVEYLNGKYGQVRYSMPTWGWLPLRQKDLARHAGNAGWRYEINGHLQPAAGQYKKAVPLPVLMLVSEIAKEFPGAFFYVSDEVKAPEPVRDPFLLVEYADMITVIEQWDEPSFTGKRV